MVSEQPGHNHLPDAPRFAEQNADGVDLTLIRENLKLTPLERVRKAERLRQHVLRIHKLAGIRRDPDAA